jgi:predicted glycoside hydrolase/deacetylase ChbG (UPF0249 family)
MIRLIVNIDDFGMSQGINRGIIDCLKFGIAKSTTIMVRMPYAENAVKLAKENGFTYFGVHLDLTEGHPVIPGRSLLPIMVYLKRNRIDKAKKIINGLNLDLKVIEKELHSQVNWLLERGITVTHLDSHHGIHGFPGINEIVLEIADRLKLPVRHWQMNFTAGNRRRNNLRRLSKAIRHPQWRLCHMPDMQNGPSILGCPGETKNSKSLPIGN